MSSPDDRDADASAQSVPRETTQPPDDSPLPVVRLGLLIEGGMGLLAVGLGWWLSVPVPEQVRFRASSIGWGLLACLPMLVSAWWLLRHTPRVLQPMSRLVRERLVPLFQGCGLLGLAIVCLAAGIGEELLFRGLLQGGLASLCGSWWAIGMASLAFGLCHAISRAYAILATLAGIYLGLVWIWTGDLLAPIWAHALYDFLVLAYLVRYEQPPTSQTLNVS